MTSRRCLRTRQSDAVFVNRNRSLFCQEDQLISKLLIRKIINICVSRNAEPKDVHRTVEIPQRTRISNTVWCLKVHNAHLKVCIANLWKVLKNLLNILNTI